MRLEGEYPIPLNDEPFFYKCVPIFLNRYARKELFIRCRGSRKNSLPGRVPADSRVFRSPRSPRKWHAIFGGQD